MIPLSTTEVQIEEPSDPTEDGSEAISWTVTDARRRGHISSPSGSEVASGGARTAVSAVLLVDSDCTVSRSARVTDLSTGEVWQASWVERRIGLGLDHVKVGLTVVHGAGR